MGTRSALKHLQLDPQDEALLVAAAERRAAEDVELACEFLLQAGLIRSKRVRVKRPQPVALSLMLKAASLMRLRQWAGAGQLRADEPGIPGPEALLADMRRPAAGQQVDAEALARTMFGIWLTRMGWSSAPPTSAAAATTPRCDVLVDRVQPELVLDALAQLLWQCRDLPNDTTHGKEEG